MSLGKLLATGKSLVGSRGEAHRFQVNKRAALPKFGKVKNPFTTATQPEVAEVRPSTAVPTEAKVRATNAPAPSAALRKLHPVRALRWAGAVSAKLNLMAFFQRKSSGATKQLPGLQAPVQRELSLDSVQVVRNDLTDADGGGALPSEKPAVVRSSGVLGMTAKAEVAMDRISSKFFGGADS